MKTQIITTERPAVAVKSFVHIVTDMVTKDAQDTWAADAAKGNGVPEGVIPVVTVEPKTSPDSLYHLIKYTWTWYEITLNPEEKN